MPRKYISTELAAALIAELIARPVGAPESPCVQWGGAHSNGYARVGGRGCVSRIVLAAKIGRPLHDGMLALHTCPGGDNKWCVNAAHLREGTVADNTSGDAVSRAQMAQGDTHWSRRAPNLLPRGERRGSAKLTPEAVIAIRGAVAQGESQRTVAARYGVAFQTVSKIVNFTKWKHVQEPLCLS